MPRAHAPRRIAPTVPHRDLPGRSGAWAGTRRVARAGRMRVGLVALALVGLSGLASAQRIESFSAFEQSSAQADADLPWIIELRTPTSTASAGEWESLDGYIDRVQEELADEMGWRNLNDIVRYESVPMMAKSLDSDEARQLLQSDKVAGLYRSEWRSSFLSQSTQLVGAQALNASGQEGRGQVVAVIDNGVDDTHPFLQGKVVDGACFSMFGNCPGGARRATGANAGRPTLDDDHGTHVAGIIAGAGSGRAGVAPHVRLLAVQAFSRHEDRTGATDADLLAALDWVYQQRTRFPIAAVNMSLGGGAFTDYCDSGSPYTGILRLLRREGIVPVIASGNDHNTHGIAAPACVSAALSIGSTDKQGRISDFSNSWSQLSFVAPGGNIESSGNHGGFVVKSGTSMATPHVAGAIALLRAARPEASAEQVIKALTEGGTPYRDPRNGAQSVLINVEQALRLIPLPAPVAPGPEPQTPPPPSRPPEAPAPPIAPPPSKPAPAPAPPRPTPAPSEPKPPAPRPDANLPLCEENIDGINVIRQPPCRRGR